MDPLFPVLYSLLSAKTIFTLLIGIVTSIAAGIASEILIRRRQRFMAGQKEETESLESGLAKTFQALQENSQRAMELLNRLQSELTDRTTRIQAFEVRLHELQQQRALLELTEDQQQALRALTRRQPSPREIFMSLDFWLGRVFPSTVFFVLGIIASVLIRRYN